MAHSERLGFWSIFIDVSGDWTCVGSKSLAGLSDRNKYKAKSGSPFALLFDIIDKINKATSATPNLPDIPVSLVPDPKGGFLMVMDHASSATAMAATVATIGSQPKAARTMAKKSATRKATVRKSKPQKDKDHKSKPAKPKADGPKDHKSKRATSPSRKSKTRKSTTRKTKTVRPKGDK